MPRGQYTGGWGAVTSCIEGDCPAVHLLEDIYDMISREGRSGREGIPAPRARSRAASARARSLRMPVAPKRRRKVSAYQKEFGRQLKKLKKKHPRTPTSKLMKRAHAATKRARRGKR